MKQLVSVNHIFSPDELSELITSEHQPLITESCEKIAAYLKSHERISELPESISEVTHVVFMQLNDEIRRFFKNEREKIFPGINKPYVHEVRDEEAVAIYKENHRLILRIVKMLRQLMCDYVLQREWSKEFRDCIVELYCLESKIYKWIEIEEDLLFPQLVQQRNTMAEAC